MLLLNSSVKVEEQQNDTSISGALLLDNQSVLSHQPAARQHTVHLAV